MNRVEPWIGLIEVQPLPGNDALEGAKGAFVNVVALAVSAEKFAELVETTMAEYGFRVVSRQDVARFIDWKQAYSVDNSIEVLVSNLTDEYPIQFDEFQAYDTED